MYLYSQQSFTLYCTTTKILIDPLVLHYVKRNEDIGVSIQFLNGQLEPAPFTGKLNLFLVHNEPEIQRNIIQGAKEGSNGK